LTNTAQPPRLRIRAMLEALLDTVDQHRYLLQAMLEARATTPATKASLASSQTSRIAGVAAVIDSERGDRAPEGAPASVVATMLLEFNDRLLERYTLG
ncbi:TetR/AcrR family transcriptional regulator, partial [Mycobacterium sp. ITM-2017-0098]